MNKKLYCDGSGWNGRHTKICVKIADGSYMVIKYKIRFTSNELEYLALLFACNLANSGDSIYTDSRLVWGQLTQHWKINSLNLWPYINEAKIMIKQKKIQLNWIAREYNQAGHILEQMNKEGDKN